MVVPYQKYRVERRLFDLLRRWSPDRPDDRRRPLATPSAELHFPLTVLFQIHIQVRMARLENLRQRLQKRLER